MAHFYRIEGGNSLSASGWTTLPNDDAGMVFWFRVVSPGQNGRVLLEGAGDLDLVVTSNDGTTYALEWRGAEVATGLAVGDMQAVVVRNNGGETTLALNGAYIAATEAITADLDGNPTFGGLGDDGFIFDVQFPAYLSVELTDTMVAGHYLNGAASPPNVSGNGWEPGVGIVIAWWDPPVAGVIASEKTPAHPLTISGRVFAVPVGGDAPTARVEQIGGAYPPVRTYYSTTGDTDSGFFFLGTDVPAIFLPEGGTSGLSAAWRWWVRRPLSPVIDSGTLLQILSGDAYIDVSVNSDDEVVVTVNDGDDGASATSSEPLVGMQWTAMTISLFSGDLRVYFDALEVAVVDISAMNFPDPDDGGTAVIIGNNGESDPVDQAPLDFDFTNVDVFDDQLTQDEIEDLLPLGHDRDLRNEGYEPVTHIVGPIAEEGVFPDEEGDSPLVPFGGSSWDVFPGTPHVWFMGDHRIGVYSPAWFASSAQSPELWSLVYGDDDYAATFGEVPRIVAVTLRSDGALLLDTDARCVPGIGYQLWGPDDLIGTAFEGFDITGPLPALLHTAPTVPALLDIDAPQGASTGFSTVPSGDYLLSGENRTVEKIIWATLLTPAGTFDWDPGFGTGLRHKRLRPADLSSERRRIAQQVAAIPYVTRADVQILFEDGEVVVAISAETDFGRLDTRRGFDATR